VSQHTRLFEVCCLMMLSMVKIIQRRWWLKECVWSTGAMTLTGEKLMYSEKNLYQCHFVHHKPHRTGQGSKLGLCSNRVANSHLKPITASWHKMWFYQNCDFSSPTKCCLTKCFLFVTGIQHQIGILFLPLMCSTTFASLKMGCIQDKDFSKNAVNFWKLCLS